MKKALLLIALVAMVASASAQTLYAPGGGYFNRNWYDAPSGGTKLSNSWNYTNANGYDLVVLGTGERAMRASEKGQYDNGYDITFQAGSKMKIQDNLDRLKLMNNSNWVYDGATIYSDGGSQKRGLSLELEQNHNSHVTLHNTDWDAGRTTWKGLWDAGQDWKSEIRVEKGCSLTLSGTTTFNTDRFALLGGTGAGEQSVLNLSDSASLIVQHSQSGGWNVDNSDDKARINVSSNWTGEIWLQGGTNFTGNAGTLWAIDGVAIDAADFSLYFSDEYVNKDNSSGNMNTNYGKQVKLLNPVPEPATMALLGLGALVLRRKK